MAGWDFPSKGEAAPTNIAQIGTNPVVQSGIVVGTMPVGLNTTPLTGQLSQISAVGDGQGNAVAMQPSSTPAAATATAGVATVTFGAVAGQQHRITSIAAGYAAVASTAATSTVTASDGTTSMVYDVPTGIAAGNLPIVLPAGGIKFLASTAVTVSLVSGVAAGSVGNVNASKLTA